MTGRRTTIESLSNPLIKRMRLLREKRAEFLFRGRGQMRERDFPFVFHLLSSSNCAKRS